MKKGILAIALLFSLTANSQVNSKAIGLRLGGGNYGTGAELSYQHGMGDMNRLELDLGLNLGDSYSHIVGTGIYHWVWNITAGLNWYAGVGAQVGLYNYDAGDGGLSVSVGGQIGIEYDFQDLGAPLLLSIDTRPMIGLINGGDRFSYGSSLGIRYIF